MEELTQFIFTKPVPPHFNKPVNPIHSTTFPGVPVDSESIPKNRKWLKYSLLGVGLLLFIILLSNLVNYFSTKDSEIEYLQAQVDTQAQRIQIDIDEKAMKESERKRINTEITARNMNFRNNWEKYISVHNSEPSVNFALGGIGEFSVMVNNETTYLLDQVDVYIEYIRKNGTLAQERTISIFNISAGSMEMSMAPSSSNGVKVKYSIIKIISEKMNFCYPSFSGNTDDPYFCK